LTCVIHHDSANLCSYTAHRVDAMEASPVPFDSNLFLHSDKALTQLVHLIRDTDMGTRKDRQQREALRRDDPEQEQRGEERQEDGLNEEEWERDLYKEWLFERNEERGEEEDDGDEEEAPDVAVEEEAGAD
jgi:hypothetical protein